MNVNYKENKWLLHEKHDFRFFNLDYYNEIFSESPAVISLLTAWFSDTMWNPNCYEYSVAVKINKRIGHGN